METATAAVEVAEAGEREWIPGKNGGRLRPGGTHGPRRETMLVKKALIESLRDSRGGAGAEFFVRLKMKKPDVYANVVAKLIPIEVAANLGGEALTVVINTLVAAPNGEMPLARARLESTSPNDATSVNVQPTAVPTVVAGETRESPERDSPRC